MFTWKPLRDPWVVLGPRFGNPPATAPNSSWWGKKRTSGVRAWSRSSVIAAWVEEIEPCVKIPTGHKATGVSDERTGKRQGGDAKARRQCYTSHWFPDDPGEKRTIGSIFHEWSYKVSWTVWRVVVYSEALHCVCLNWPTSVSLDSMCGTLGTHLVWWRSSDNKLLWWSGASSPLSAATKPIWRRRGGLRWVNASPNYDFLPRIC